MAGPALFNHRGRQRAGQGDHRVHHTDGVGFKDLTATNWRAPDPTSRLFVRSSPLVGPVQMDGDDWTRAFLSVELDEKVPHEIKELFAVARGVLLYGWFFYPLYRLGEEQLHRVAESAAAHRYRQLCGPKRHPSYSERLEWLIDHGAIPEEERERWTAGRILRNYGSHPEVQAVVTPGQALGMLKATAAAIDALCVPFRSHHARERITLRSRTSGS